jgi:hypothetical protein
MVGMMPLQDGVRMTSDRSSQWFHHPRHGPLPALLLVLTVATGVVDAVSILALGRVFIANMTGNIVFLGFAWQGPLDSPWRPRCSRWPAS